MPFIECVVDKEEMGLGVHQYNLSVMLNDNQEAFAMSALKRIVNRNTSYQFTISEGLDEEDEDQGYKGKLSCNAGGTEFMLYDDVHDLHGMKTGAARRELGLVVLSPRPKGQTVRPPRASNPPRSWLGPRARAAGRSGG